MVELGVVGLIKYPNGGFTGHEANKRNCHTDLIDSTWFNQYPIPIWFIGVKVFKEVFELQANFFEKSDWKLK